MSLTPSASLDNFMSVCARLTCDKASDAAMASASLLASYMHEWAMSLRHLQCHWLLVRVKGLVLCIAGVHGLADLCQG